MPKPEGYRKALRAMKLAEKFGRPVLTFIDTPGAYPGIDAEERGQAEAIAYNLREMAKLRVPVIVTIIGEGGSGGALAIGVGDQVLMLENSIYSVITPEGCAAILWKDSSQADRAAVSLRLTAEDLYKEEIIDQIVQEPQGGAHADYDKTAEMLDTVILEKLSKLVKGTHGQRIVERYRKLRRYGKWGQL
jgi:acetyl-CoA carboxylase carboxyl transferase subunit alpha